AARSRSGDRHPRLRAVGVPPPCPRAGAPSRAATAAPACVAPGGSSGAGGPAAPARRASRTRPGKRGRGPLRPRPSLPDDHGVHPPVPGPAGVVLLVAERELLAVADGRQPVGGDALGDEVVLYRLRPLRAEREVVLDRTAAVAMSL